MPVYRRGPMVMADAAAAPAAETYQPGEMKFNAVVNVEYDLLVNTD
jgi:uncharacterized protein YggE